MASTNFDLNKEINNKLFKNVQELAVCIPPFKGFLLRYFFDYFSGTEKLSVENMFLLRLSAWDPCYKKTRQFSSIQERQKFVDSHGLKIPSPRWYGVFFQINICP